MNNDNNSKFALEARTKSSGLLRHCSFIPASYPGASLDAVYVAFAWARTGDKNGKFGAKCSPPEPAHARASCDVMASKSVWVRGRFYTSITLITDKEKLSVKGTSFVVYKQN